MTVCLLAACYCSCGAWCLCGCGVLADFLLRVLAVVCAVLLAKVVLLNVDVLLPTDW